MNSNTFFLVVLLGALLGLLFLLIVPIKIVGWILLGVVVCALLRDLFVM